ncbi:MAG: hypothetical protein LBB83_12490 [Treponema sp.]|nr:hypothetical protein [Treponema sp.]
MTRILFLVVFLFSILSLNAEVSGHWSSKCRYCGSANFGSGCPYGAEGKHVHVGDEKHCVYCGSSSYGSGCPYSENRRHLHGHGNDKCIYCGSGSVGSGCSYSPNRKHER